MSKQLHAECWPARGRDVLKVYSAGVGPPASPPCDLIAVAVSPFPNLAAQFGNSPETFFRGLHHNLVLFRNDSDGEHVGSLRAVCGAKISAEARFDLLLDGGIHRKAMPCEFDQFDPAIALPVSISAAARPAWPAPETGTRFV